MQLDELQAAWDRRRNNPTVRERLADIFYWPLYRAYHRLRDLPGDIRTRWQRSKDGYARSDLWSVGSYLLETMENALVAFRDENDKYGVPGIYLDEVPEGLDWEQRHEWAIKRQHEDITYITDRLKAYREVWEEHEWEKHGRNIEQALSNTKKGLREAFDKFVEIEPSLWD